MDYNYYSLNPFDYETTKQQQQQQQQQQLVNDLKKSSKSLYTNGLNTAPSYMASGATTPGTTNSLYASQTNLYTSSNMAKLASSQYLRLPQSINSGASTAPPIAQVTNNNYVYNLDDFKLNNNINNNGNSNVNSSQNNIAAATSNMPLLGSSLHLNATSTNLNINNNNNGSNIYSSLGTLAHSNTRSTLRRIMLTRLLTDCLLTI